MTSRWFGLLQLWIVYFFLTYQYLGKMRNKHPSHIESHQHRFVGMSQIRVFEYASKWFTWIHRWFDHYVTLLNVSAKNSTCLSGLSLSIVSDMAVHLEMSIRCLFAIHGAARYFPWWRLHKYIKVDRRILMGGQNVRYWNVHVCCCCWAGQLFPAVSPPENDGISAEHILFHYSH